MPAFPDKFQKTIVILSTGRTGTKALASHFDAVYDDVKALHEPKPSRNLQVASNLYLYGRISQDELIRRFVRSRRRLFSEIREPNYIESNHFLNGFFDSFDRLFPAPLILHIVRDPRSYVRSHVNYGTFQGWKGLVVRYHPTWMLKPENLKNGSDYTWKSLPLLERVAWRWNSINQILERCADLYGDRYRRVRFEDLFGPDESFMQSLVDWMGFPWKAEFAERSRSSRINASNRSELSAWEDWPAEDLQAVEKHCRDLMEQYGYPLAASRDPVTTHPPDTKSCGTTST